MKKVCKDKSILKFSVFSQTEKVRSLRLDVPQAAELRDELAKAGIPMPEGIIDTGECAHERGQPV